MFFLNEEGNSVFPYCKWDIMIRSKIRWRALLSNLSAIYFSVPNTRIALKNVLPWLAYDFKSYGVEAPTSLQPEMVKSVKSFT